MNTVKRIFALLAVGLLLLSFCGAAFADNRYTTVYVTDTGTKYHSYGCSYLNKSCNSRTLEEAAQAGFTACSKCKPPLPDFSVSATPKPTPKPTYQSASNVATPRGVAEVKTTVKNFEPPLWLCIILFILAIPIFFGAFFCMPFVILYIAALIGSAIEIAARFILKKR